MTEAQLLENLFYLGFVLLFALGFIGGQQR